jgi:hypothetical protein
VGLGESGFRFGIPLAGEPHGVVGHTLLAAASGKNATDERDEHYMPDMHEILP